MPMRYFPHQTSSQRDPKIVRLKHNHGMTGYGVYWSLLEMLYETDDCELELDTYAIGVLLECEPELVSCVINDFNLFTVDADRGRFWSESARRTMNEYATEQKTKQEQRRERARKACQARWAKKENQQEQTDAPPEEEVQTAPVEEEKVEEPVTPDEPQVSDAEQVKEEDATVPPTDAEETADDSAAPEVEAEPVSAPEVETAPTPVAEDSAQSTSARLSEFLMAEPIDEPPEMQDESVGVMAEVCEMIILKWNQAVAGTKQVYRGLMLDSIAFHRLQEAFEQRYTITDIEEAIAVAAQDDFSWQLKNVLKPDNIQLLLAKKEKEYARGRKRKPRGRTDADETANTTEAFGINWESYGAEQS